MNTTPAEPADIFSHVRKAMGAIGLAALGATVLIGILPLVIAPRVEPVAQREEPARPELPAPVLANPGR